MLTHHNKKVVKTAFSVSDVVFLKSNDSNMFSVTEPHRIYIYIYTAFNIGQWKSIQGSQSRLVKYRLRWNRMRWRHSKRMVSKKFHSNLHTFIAMNEMNLIVEQRTVMTSRRKQKSEWLQVKSWSLDDLNTYYVSLWPIGLRIHKRTWRTVPD